MNTRFFSCIRTNIPTFSASYLIRQKQFVHNNYLFTLNIPKTTNRYYATTTTTTPPPSSTTTTTTTTTINKNDVLITPEEVARHNTLDDLWTAIHGDVYNVTGFVDEHPGGDIIITAAGKDGTKLFEEQGHGDEARQLMKKWKIGKLLSGKPRYSEASPTSPTEPMVGKPGY